MIPIVKQVAEKTSRRKGGFKKDGTTHHTGIKNEHNIVNFLNQPDSIIGNHLRLTTDHIITHKGGTQIKADAVVFNQSSQKEEFTLSIKNHKTGTFDWLNSTKGFPEDIQKMLKERTKEIKTAYLEHQNIDSSRLEVDAMFSNALHQLRENHCFLWDIIHTIHQKYTDGILIHHEKESSLIYFEKKELKELQGFDDYTYFLKHQEGTCSAQIIRKKDTEEINTSLRIRLVLNNGVNALVGTSSKNKTSVPCLKIQQDKVDEFLNKIENKKNENYNLKY
jgi:hypothetical protein